MIVKNPHGGVDLRSVKTGKLLGHHATRAGAVRQEVAIEIAKHHAQRQAHENASHARCGTRKGGR